MTKYLPPLSEALMAEARKVSRWQRNPYRALLQARFPECFRPFGKPKIPMKLHIYHDIRARIPELKARQVHIALSDYTGGPSYHRACVAGAPRVDLDGYPAGTVSAEEAAFHADALEHLKAKWAREAMTEADPDYKGADADPAGAE